LVDAMLARSSRVLDAGCGPGRVGADLAARGHTVVGVDADPELIAAAIADHPGPRWLVEDLSELDLAAQGEPEPFDAAVLAGNVMPYVAPGTEPLVLARVGAHVRPDGIVVIGFSVDRGYPLTDLDSHAEAAGLHLESRFATWDLRPFAPGGDYAVSIFRV
jgi:SAM-dependent methyltransferase